MQDIDVVKIIREDSEHRNQVLISGYTGCDVLVMGLWSAISYQPESSYEVCISISTTNHGIFNPKLSERFVDILRLDFDDIAVGDAHDPSAHSITDEDADKVVEFARKHIYTANRMIIHCYAGASRSRSMAAALCECFGLPFKYTILNNHVVSQIHNAFDRMK